MNVLIATIVTFGLAFLFHLVWWRVRFPRYQTRALMVIFFLFYGVESGVLFMRPEWIALEAVPAWIGWLYFSAFYWGLALCYVITYSAMEGGSPTLSLVRLLSSRGEEGMTQDEVEAFFRERPFIGARVKALVNDKIFVEEVEGYRLAPGGYVFFRLILGYRRVVFGRIKAGG